MNNQCQRTILNLSSLSVYAYIVCLLFSSCTGVPRHGNTPNDRGVLCKQPPSLPSLPSPHRVRSGKRLIAVSDAFAPSSPRKRARMVEPEEEEGCTEAVASSELTSPLTVQADPLPATPSVVPCALDRASKGISPVAVTSPISSPEDSNAKQGDIAKSVPQTTFSDSWSMVDHDLPILGKNILQQVWNGRELSNEILEQDYVASIIHYLFQKAEQKGNGFNEGAFVVEDQDHALFNRLCELSGSYKRISSHRIGNNMSAHYGFDLPEGLIRPTDKRHVLFFSTVIDKGKKVIFIKPENYGTQQLDHLVNHSIEYLESFAKRYSLIWGDIHNPSQERKERVIYLDPSLKQAICDCIQTLSTQDDSVVCADLGDSYEFLPHNEDTLQQKFQQNGISLIVTLLQKKEYGQSATVQGELYNLMTLLDSKSMDHLNMRTAKEVILTKDELLPTDPV